jgi:hypothetical protein
VAEFYISDDQSVSYIAASRNVTHFVGKNPADILEEATFEEMVWVDTHPLGKFLHASNSDSRIRVMPSQDINPKLVLVRN